MQLFQYAIFFVPNAEQVKNGEKSIILANPTTVLAQDVNGAQILASRAIPEEYVDKLSQVTVAVRPF